MEEGTVNRERFEVGGVFDGMWFLLASAIAPTLMLLGFVYLRDRYELEPWKWVLKVFVSGFLIAYPTFVFESVLNQLADEIAYHSYIVTGLTEELTKFLVTVILVYRSKEFNEAFDGIVYAVAASLGFATLENIFYVMSGGLETAAVRALLPVSAHALFAIIMGYCLGVAKFETRSRRRKAFLMASIGIPVFMHGTYDLLLLSGFQWVERLVIPFMICLWGCAWRFMRIAGEKSPFNPRNLPASDDSVV
jgi:RsiW-degrading membrane proteinase PrsW (M82 family)